MRYVKITRSDSPGFYIQPIKKINEAIQAEFDGFEEDMVTGESFTMTIIEMDEQEYKKLPEFSGW